MPADQDGEDHYLWFSQSSLKRVPGGHFANPEHPVPALGPRQVKIRVRNSCVDRADLAQRNGTHQAATPDHRPAVVGLDAAGDINGWGAR